MTISENKTVQESKRRLFSGKIKERMLLTKEGSTKKTYHLALELEGEVSFRVGDSLGIYAHNDPILVERYISALKATGEELVLDTRSKETLSLRSFLLHKANLSRLTSSLLNLVQTYEPIAQKKQPLQLLLQPENKPLLLDYLASHHPLDVLQLYPEAKIPLQELVNQFGPLLPRFYSVASSKKMHAQEVHLTVGLTDFIHKGEKRYGVASHFLCHLAEIGKTSVPFYIQSGHHFTLPDNPDASIIMIGPGTGIAPYRAFLQERQVLEHKGKNWLFFGERNRKTDFFYEEFWNELSVQNKLRLDLAFSRDQQEKIYVQHKMEEQASDLWAWIQEGAYLYVCGDASQMAKDVEASLIKIISEQGKMSVDEAKAYLKSLRAQKRYLLDVY